MKCLLIIFVRASNSHLETKSRKRVQDKVVSGSAGYWFVLGAPVISHEGSVSATEKAFGASHALFPSIPAPILFITCMSAVLSQ